MKPSSTRIILPALLLLGVLLIALLKPGYAQQNPVQPVPGEVEASVNFIESRQGIDPNASDIYLVRLVDPPLAAYRGGIAGLEATNPRVRGENKLNPLSPASLAYRDYLLAQQAAFIEKLEGLAGRKIEVKFQYYAANNGLALYLSGEEAALAASLPEVVFVQPNFRRELQTDVSPAWIGATGIWDGSTTGGLPGTKGEGIIVGVIDTGINPSNPSFADVGADGYNHTNPWGAGVYKGVCDTTNSLYDPTFPCNDKLIGAWAYTGINSGNARDYEGHGSHTASTAAGNVVNAQVNGNTISITRQISGIAPHANIVAYAACCNGDTLSAAIDQIVLDGVDVANYSIGSASPSDPWNDFDSVGFLNARDAGIFVATSAGNNGPDPATLGSPGDAPWITTVAASTHNRKVTNAIINMSGGNTTPPADMLGASFTSAYGPAKIVYAGDYGDALCLNPFPANTWTNGEIVICDRGIIARVDKGANVQAGGAGGLILANSAADGEGVVADDHYLPAVHIGYQNGLVLKAWVADGGSNHTGTIRGSLLETNDDWGDFLTDFTSRGPNRALGDIVKPDVAAPGKDVLAAVGINDPLPPEYTFYDGTSMASPHIAGAGALLMALHPTWTPAEIQSALMSTAWQDMLDYDQASLPTPFEMGSGRVDLSVAAKAGLVLNETKANYDAANPETGGDPSTLNLASFGNGACYQTCSWTRTLRSTQGSSVTWTVDVSAADGLDLVVSPSSFVIPAGGTQVLTVDADARRIAPDTWAFGKITLTPSDPAIPTAHFPVAVFANSSSDIEVFEKSADINLAQVNDTIQYTITLTHRSLSSKTYSISDPVPANAAYINGSASGGLTYNSGTNTLSWSGTLPAGSFTIYEDNRAGYISMGDLGAPPASAPSSLDSGCLLVSLNDLNYFGNIYTTGVWSVNGTLQAGAPPITCAGNTNGQVPSSSPPNNLLAPFWSDLDFTSGGQWYFVGVSWNGAPHTVFSWENVPIKGTANTASFQLWFEEGTDNIWFAYPPGGLPAGTNATIGAENSAGTSGYNYYYNGSGTLPDGTSDLVLGPQPIVNTFGFQVSATGTPDITNTATLTEGALTRQAYAFTDVVTQNTWVGNSANWQTPSNWTRNAVPGAADWVIVPSAPGGGNMPDLTANAAVYNLEIQPGADLDLSTYALSVKGSVINNGTLLQTISSVPANTTTAFLNLTNASGAQDKYFGVQINPTSGPMGSTMVQIKGNAQCTATDPTDTVNRCYEITPSTSQTANIDFYYLDSELDGLVPESLKAWYWTGSAWSSAGTVQARTSIAPDYRRLSVSGVSAYAPFALTDKLSGPTVVELANLSVEQKRTALDGGLQAGAVLLAVLGMIALAYWWNSQRKSAAGKTEQ